MNGRRAERCTSCSDFPLPFECCFFPLALTLILEVNLAALDRSSDFWYNAAGAPRNFTAAAVGSGGGYRINPAYGTSLGQEVDLLASWAVARGALLEAGAAHFFRGDYVKESLSDVGSKDATYVYLQLTLNL